MPLAHIRIENFRCIEKAELSLDARRSYVFGPNGAGKTSLLEAIYLLSRGRSFRTRQSKRLIRHGQEALTLVAEAHAGERRRRLGLRLGEEGLKARIDGADAEGIAALARVLPAHVIEPSIHALIEGPPSVRRRFLDWGVFHVEHAFLEAWRRYRRVLGQRNAALKRGFGTADWDRVFIEAGSAVHSLREAYVSTLSPIVGEVGRALIGTSVELAYRRGWSAEQALEGALESSAERERRLGATQVGPHRADLRVTLGSRGVREEASRGQQKLVAAALVLSQVRVFAQTSGDGGVLLVDDPAAELDTVAFGRLMAALEDVPAQLVLTGLSESTLPPATGFPVFHVEQGKVAAMV